MQIQIEILETLTIIQQLYIGLFISHQAFIQAVLLMSVSEQRLGFQMLHFIENDHKIIVKCRWRS